MDELRKILLETIESYEKDIKSLNKFLEKKTFFKFSLIYKVIDILHLHLFTHLHSFLQYFTLSLCVKNCIIKI